MLFWTVTIWPFWAIFLSMRWLPFKSKDVRRLIPAKVSPSQHFIYCSSVIMQTYANEVCNRCVCVCVCVFSSSLYCLDVCYVHGTANHQSVDRTKRINVHVKCSNSLFRVRYAVLGYIIDTFRETSTTLIKEVFWLSSSLNYLPCHSFQKCASEDKHLLSTLPVPYMYNLPSWTDEIHLSYVFSD